MDKWSPQKRIAVCTSGRCAYLRLRDWLHAAVAPSCIRVPITSGQTDLCFKILILFFPRIDSFFVLARLMFQYFDLDFLFEDFFKI
jgi:hypothetical protein